jgi:hypothetical protein
MMIFAIKSGSYILLTGAPMKNASPEGWGVFVFIILNSIDILKNLLQKVKNCDKIIDTKMMGETI